MYIKALDVGSRRSRLIANIAVAVSLALLVTGPVVALAARVIA